MTSSCLTSLKKGSQTLRFRLAAWNATVVILTAVVTLLVLRQGVRWAILHEMDTILTEDINEIALALSDLPGGQLESVKDALDRKAVGHRHHGWFVQLLDQEGRIVWASADFPETRHTPAAGQSQVPYTRGDFRLARRSIPPAPHGIATIRVGASLRFLREDMARIDRTVFLAAGLVLVLAPATGYWLASRAVRPVGQIIQTAARLRPSHLEERLPVRGTGDELDRLAHTVNGLLDRIAVYLQEKRDFLADAAHELRTPLAAIRSSVEVALGGDRTREEYEDLLVEVIDQGAALEMLVNQLLLLSETEAERLKSEFADIPLDEIVARAVDMFQGVAESRGIALQFRHRPPLHVPGKRHLLRQLVNNLLDNAIKYTPPGGHVTVGLDLDADHQGAVLTVADTGIGIAPADVPHIFDRFFRADKSRSRLSETVGTGLGLSICQAVAAAHGGRIACESQLTKGTHVSVWLPVNSASTDTRTSPPQLAPESCDELISSPRSTRG